MPIQISQNFLQASKKKSVGQKKQDYRDMFRRLDQTGYPFFETASDTIYRRNFKSKK
jgi:hypothetical protein